MNTITGGNDPSCSGCVTNVGIRPALVGISTMRSFIALYLVPPRSMLDIARTSQNVRLVPGTDIAQRPARLSKVGRLRARRYARGVATGGELRRPRAMQALTIGN